MLDEAFGYADSFWEYKPGRLLLPENFHNMAKEILDAEVREDDVWVISYPKTGKKYKNTKNLYFLMRMRKILSKYF